LTLVGTGRDWDRIAALVKSLDLADKVELPGLIPIGDMPRFYQKLDLFLVPRKQAVVAKDTTPLKPLEAIACGCPVLASDLPAMRELLAQQKGVRFCEPNAAAFADGIARFHTEPWQTDGNVGDRTWDHEIQRYAGIYERAMAAQVASSAAQSSRHSGSLHGRLRQNANRLADRGWLRPAGISPRRGHVVACGFPRTGSTLLQMMVRASVADCDAPPSECSALGADQAIRRNEPYLLTKRPGDILQLDRIRRELAQQNVRPLFLLMVRDPRDILTSRHAAYPGMRGYYVSPDRFRAVWKAIAANRSKEDCLVLRYEDLVQQTDLVQEQLTERIGWKVTAPFSRFHERCAPRDSITEGALGGLRSVDASGIGRWQQAEHTPRLLSLLEALPELPDVCQTLGYEADPDWVESLRANG
jgi:hypothetical protein